MSDWRSEDFDPEADRQTLHKRCAELGMDWLSFNGLLRAEWHLFEARLDAWCKSKYAETGVQVPDWVRQKARSKFNAILVKNYGTKDIDSDAEVKLPLPNEEEINTRFRARAASEFGIRRGGVAGSLADTLAGVAAVKAAMNAPAQAPMPPPAMPEAEVASPTVEPVPEPAWDEIAEIVEADRSYA